MRISSASSTGITSAFKRLFTNKPSGAMKTVPRTSTDAVVRTAGQSSNSSIYGGSTQGAFKGVNTQSRWRPAGSTRDYTGEFIGATSSMNQGRTNYLNAVGARDEAKLGLGIANLGSKPEAALFKAKFESEGARVALQSLKLGQHQGRTAALQQLNGLKPGTPEYIRGERYLQQIDKAPSSANLQAAQQRYDAAKHFEQKIAPAQVKVAEARADANLMNRIGQVTGKPIDPGHAAAVRTSEARLAYKEARSANVPYEQQNAALHKLRRAEAEEKTLAPLQKAATALRENADIAKRQAALSGRVPDKIHEVRAQAAEQKAAYERLRIEKSTGESEARALRDSGQPYAKEFAMAVLERTPTNTDLLSQARKLNMHQLEEKFLNGGGRY